MNKKTLENLYQTGRKEVSPSSLDNFILTQAQESCKTNTDHKNTKNLKKTKPLWFIPLSTAAIVVLSFSIIITMQQNIQIENGFSTPQIETIENSSTNHDAGALLQNEYSPNKKRINKRQNPHTEKEAAYSAPKANVQNQPIMNEITQVKKSKAVALKKTNKAALKPVFERKIEKKARKQEGFSIGALVETKSTLGTNKQKKSDLEKLTLLIKKHEGKKAMELISQLQIKYPDYDFSKLLLEIDLQ